MFKNEKKKQNFDLFFSGCVFFAKKTFFSEKKTSLFFSGCNSRLDYMKIWIWIDGWGGGATDRVGSMVGGGGGATDRVKEEKKSNEDGRIVLENGI